MSVVASVVGHALLRSAVDTWSNSHAEKVRRQMAMSVEQYYMTFFGEIFLADERQWILLNKIRPLVAKMSSVELRDILKLRDRNAKLIRKNRPIEKALVERRTIEAYHLEYQDFIRDKKRAKEMEQRRRLEAIQAEKDWKKYVQENGESEASLINNFFD